MDMYTPEKRSIIMRLIKSQDTMPELFVRKLIYSLGYRYRLHNKKLPGRPDLVFSKIKKVIFVHGCFWHQHNNCIDGKIPKSRLEYWEPKLNKNLHRDQEVQNQLKLMKWEYLIIWECEIKNSSRLTKKIIKFLDSELN